MADFHRSIENQGAVEACGGVPCLAVGEALRRAELDRQYLRDLEVIERCEADMVARGGCPDFFGCMGRIQRG